MLEGIALANPDTLKYVPGVQPHHAHRRTQRRQGLDPAGLRLRPRARARHGRRQGHARRRLPGRRVRRAADGLRATRRRKLLATPQGRAAHRQQLHRRPHGVRHGQGDGRGRGHPHRDHHGQRRRRRSRTRPTPSGRRGVAGNFFVIKAVGAASEKGADLDELVADRQQGQLRHPDDGHGADVVHAAGEGLAAVRAGRRRDRDRRRHPRRAGPPPREADQRRRDRRRDARRRRHRPAVRVGRRRRADDQRPGRHADQRALHPLPAGRIEQLADKRHHRRRSYVGEYCTSLDMAGASLTLVRLDDELRELLDAPAEVPIRVF